MRKGRAKKILCMPLPTKTATKPRPRETTWSLPRKTTSKPWPRKTTTKPWKRKTTTKPWQVKPTTNWQMKTTNNYRFSAEETRTTDFKLYSQRYSKNTALKFLRFIKTMCYKISAPRRRGFSPVRYQLEYRARPKIEVFRRHMRAKDRWFEEYIAIIL